MTRLEELVPLLRGCITPAGNVEVVDVYMAQVPVNRDNAEVIRPRFEAALDEWPTAAKLGWPVPPLSEGPSYIHIGGVLDSQDAALQFMAVGQVLGLWKIVGPRDLGFQSDKEVEDLVGIGFVFITGYEGVDWVAAR